MQEHYQLCLDNFNEKNVDGKLVIGYSEKVSKTFAGGIKSLNKKPKKVLAFENTTYSDRCIVRMFRKYLSHRPNDMESFYLRPNDNPKSHVWFAKSRIGVNTVSQIVKDMCKEVGFVGYFTNHSLRATSAMTLPERN